MRIIKATFLAVVCAMFCCGCQNVVSLKSGSLATLKGSKVVNLEYSYEGMKVGNKTEQEYARDMMEKLDKKSPGAGTNWLDNWQNSRVARFQPKFEQLLNKQLEARNADLHFGNHPEAKYTLLLKTTAIKLGYNAGIMARPSFLDADAIVFETQNRENQVAEVTFRKMVGVTPMGVPFEQGWRVQESYAKTGKELGARVAKKVK
jgi:hypothetical protein